MDGMKDGHRPNAVICTSEIDVGQPTFSLEPNIDRIDRSVISPEGYVARRMSRVRRGRLASGL